jgi:hypothetical protein
MPRFRIRRLFVCSVNTYVYSYVAELLGDVRKDWPMLVSHRNLRFSYGSRWRHVVFDITPYALASQQVRCPILQIILQTISESHRLYLKETCRFDASVFQMNKAESGDFRCPGTSHGGLVAIYKPFWTTFCTHLLWSSRLDRWAVPKRR